MSYTVNYKVKSTGIWSEVPGDTTSEATKDIAELFVKQDDVSAVYILNKENKHKEFLKGSSKDLTKSKRKFFKGFNF